MSATEKEFQKYTLKMLSTIGNKVFVELDFLKAEDKSLSYEQKKKLLTLGENVAASARLKRWSQFFRKEQENIYKFTDKPWVDMNNAGTVAQFLDAYRAVKAGGTVPKSRNSLESHQLKAFYLSRNKDDFSTLINEFGLDKKDSFITFVNDNLYQLAGLISKVKGSDSLLERIFEYKALDNEGLNTVLKGVTGYINEPKEVIKAIDRFAPEVDYFENDLLDNSVLDYYFYLGRDGHISGIDFNRLQQGLDLLERHQGKIMWSDPVSETPSGSLGSLLLYSSLSLADSSKSKAKKIEILDKMWSVLDRIPVDYRDLERVFSDGVVSDHIVFLPEIFDKIARRCPDSYLCLEATGDLSTRDWKKLVEILKINEKAYPDLVTDVDSFIDEVGADVYELKPM